MFGSWLRNVSVSHLRQSREINLQLHYGHLFPALRAFSDVFGCRGSLGILSPSAFRALDFAGILIPVGFRAFGSLARGGFIERLPGGTPTREVAMGTYRHSRSESVTGGGNPGFGGGSTSPVTVTCWKCCGFEISPTDPMGGLSSGLSMICERQFHPRALPKPSCLRFVSSFSPILL